MITDKDILESKKVFLKYIKETKLEGISPDWFNVYVMTKGMSITIKRYYNFDDIIKDLGKLLKKYKNIYSVIHIDAWWYRKYNFLTLCSLSTK